MKEKIDNTMILKNLEFEKYLMKFGWTPERKVQLPAYIDISSTPEIVLNILSNLYGLKFIDPKGYEREFLVPKEYIDDFDSDMQEWKEDTGLDLSFFPLGTMDEHGGILVIDQFGRFYLAGDELLFYGNNFEQCMNVIIFRRRCGLAIREEGSTFFTYNNKNTGVCFDKDKGWLGNQECLTLEYITSQMQG